MRRIAIVDGWSTGRHLAPALRGRGIESCIHVQSARTLPARFLRAFQPSDFDKNVIHDGDLSVTSIEATLGRIGPVTDIIAGAETGVLLADHLSEAAGVRTNGRAQSRARRDKHEMFETVGRNGLRVAKHAAGRSAEEILERAERESITYPLVVKPSASAGADCVKFCEHPEDVRAACAQIHGQVNALGLVNEQVVVQEMLRGEEFIVNTVSTDGVHRVADILICGKRRVPGHGMLSEVEKLVPCNGQEQAHLVQYVYRVLDALGIRFGPSHIELMYTPEGPMLIELAARLQGAIDPNAMALCTGTSHVHLSVDALVDPDGFLQQAHCGYPFRNNLYRVLLSSRRSGVLAGLPGLDCIRRLASFHDVQMWVGPGDRVNETLDFVHCPGYLHLVHSDRNVVERDYQVVRSLQDDGLFDWQT